MTFNVFNPYLQPNQIEKKDKKEFVFTYKTDLLPRDSNEEKYFILIKCSAIIMSPNGLQTYNLAWRKMYNSYYFSYRHNIFMKDLNMRIQET